MQRTLNKLTKTIFVTLLNLNALLFRKIFRLSRQIKSLNTDENVILTAEFIEKVRQIKENNSKEVYINHYLPKAAKWLHLNNKPLNAETIKAKAALMMCDDIASGDLDEFYLFKYN